VSIEDAAEQPAELPDPRRRGRRRDADVDRRILDVARAVYAERGWAGFNFDVVAHQARVSKDAIYRRYTSKINLLLSTLAHPVGDQFPSNGDIRAYLIDVANWYFRISTTSHGVNSLRIFVEARQNPELLEAYHQERSAPVVVHTRASIRAAMEAGLLPDASSPVAVLDAILGGVVMHVLATPPDLHERMLAGSQDYLIELVDLVLRGCGYDFGTG
jgi:AcrR family transcriptional regulator